MKPVHMMHVETLEFQDDGKIPNNRLPVIIYREATPPDTAEAVFRRALAQSGWGDIWVNGVYDYHHYHSTAHEFLGVLTGDVDLMLGGDLGKQVLLKPGDAVVLPAGTGHKCIRSSSDFKILGAYPDGQHWDLLTGKLGERPKALENILRVPLPARDPVYGDVGPLKALWH